MPLLPQTLEAELLSYLSDPQPTEAGAVTGWSDALSPYVSGIVPPSTAQAAAKAAFESSFQANVSPVGFISALSVYASTLAAGMAPPGVPPPAPLDLSSFLSNPDRSYEEAAQELAVAIDLWWRTGTIGVAPFTPWS